MMVLDSGEPLVSVGIPTYNRAGVLQRAVESVLAQDYPNLEVVISDNASTDDTRSLCEELCRRDSRVRYIRQTVNVGPVANYAVVLRYSHGEYYMAFADDDWLDANYVSQCVRALLAQPEVVLVCGKWRFFRGQEFLGEGQNKFSLLQESGRSRVLTYYQKLVDANIFFHGVIRRDLLGSMPPMRNAVAADWPYIASIAFIGKMITLEGTTINKSVEGASASWAKTARSVGFPVSQATYWYLFLPMFAFLDIAWASPVYKSIGWWARLSLACQVFVLLVWKFVNVPVQARLRKKRWYQYVQRLIW